MCDVCVAERVLKEETEFEGRNRIIYVVRARCVDDKNKNGRCAEFKPAEFQIKVKGKKWGNKWIYTHDLAGEMMRLGFDIRIDCMDDVNELYTTYCIARTKRRDPRCKGLINR